MLVYSAIIFVLKINFVIGKRSKVALMYSKGRTDPTSFWPIESSQDMDASIASVTMYNLPVVSSGPQVKSTPLQALEFPGSPMSYIEIPNTDDSFNGIEAMCWEFYLYYEDVQESVLLEYEGTQGGIQLRIMNNSLKAILHTSTGQKLEHLYENILTPSQWIIVGINFNVNWDDEEFDIFTINDPDSQNVAESIMDGSSYPGDLRLDARGSIRIGQDHGGKFVFKGKMSCFQFYSIALFKSTKEESGLWCDPAVWSGGFSGDPMSSVQFTSVATLTTPTETTTDHATTIPVVTTEEKQSTTPIISTNTRTTTQFIATAETTTLAQTTTEQALQTTQQTPSVTVTYKPPLERCFRFKKAGVNFTLKSAFLTDTLSSLKECIDLCIGNSTCRVFSIFSIGLTFHCSLGYDVSDMLPLSGSTVYSLES